MFYFGQIVLGLARDLALFPLWWYTRGFLELAKTVNSFWADSLRGLNLVVWLKNIFVPMYGQRDLTGILISIGMRIVQIIFRSLWFAILLVLGVAVMLAWLALPLVILWQLIWQLT